MNSSPVAAEILTAAVRCAPPPDSNSPPGLARPTASRICSADGRFRNRASESDRCCWQQARTARPGGSGRGDFVRPLTEEQREGSRNVYTEAYARRTSGRILTTTWMRKRIDGGVWQRRAKIPGGGSRIQAVFTERMRRKR